MIDGFYVAHFEKVSLEQFKKDMDSMIKSNMDNYNINTNYPINDVSFDEFCEELYQKIKIPSRATYESAGYDFYTPFAFDLGITKSIVIPTGIRCHMMPGYSLDIYPKSGLGFKNNLKIANTIGIIDSDYYNSSNEGHIMVKLDYQGFLPLAEGFIHFNEGKSFVQGIFHEVFYASNDVDNSELKKRDGGFGSTN